MSDIAWAVLGVALLAFAPQLLAIAIAPFYALYGLIRWLVSKL